MKTGHCPWSGKESELMNPMVRRYLDGLPHREKPTRSMAAYIRPRLASREAVRRKEAM